jgi:hypothetical protein
LGLSNQQQRGEIELKRDLTAPRLLPDGDARRARAEADYQTRRALNVDPDNDEVRKLRDEVDKLLQINSD